MEANQSIIINANAHISECQQYRYWLNRIWDESKTLGCFICINPSKATAEYSDQTIGNCNTLAVKWDWGGFYIVNLFAFMATDQADLQASINNVGIKNNSAILYVTSEVLGPFEIDSNMRTDVHNSLSIILLISEINSLRIFLCLSDRQLEMT